jgi:FkbM family methyltransferase
MSLGGAEQRVKAVLARTPVASVVEPQRAVRFAEYLAVGASGAVLDVGLTASTLGATHYLVANAVGFAAANSWNFALNHRVTFDSPDGSLTRQYPAYLAWHVATFVIRAVVLALLVEAAGVPVLVASAVGIGAASVANFVGSERIFGTSTVARSSLGASVGRAMNRVVHALYTERVRNVLARTGLYAPLYGCYQRVLGGMYPDGVLDVDVAGANARVHMEDDAEVLSVLHTLRKEREMVEDFAASIQADDVVWDVGANLGVFSLLAADQAVDGRVVAFEPFRPTARRLQENVALTDPVGDVDVETVALWNETGWTELGVDRVELGTQTPTLDARSGQDMIIAVQAVGDELVDAGQQPAPDVLKVDVEGAELPVLDGLEATLDDCRLIYVEDHSALWGGEDAGDELQERLERHGFDVDVERQGGQAYYRGEA